MGSLGDTLPPARKYNTELTDYSIAHGDKTGPYAENLEVDALVVGAGFGMPSHPKSAEYRLTNDSRHIHAQNPARPRPQNRHFRSR